MSELGPMHLKVGQELRRARKSQKLTLRAVASALGVSPSLLSQVANDKTQPSVGTLYALVELLGVSLDSLMSPHAPSQAEKPIATNFPTSAIGDSCAVAFENNSTQRADNNSVIEMQTGVVWERLAVGDCNFVDPLVATYQSGGSSALAERMLRHAGIEFGCIIEGELILKLDGDTFVLKKGDSFSFQSERPHRFDNQSDSPARGVSFGVRRDET